MKEQHHDTLNEMAMKLLHMHYDIGGGIGIRSLIKHWHET